MKKNLMFILPTLCGGGAEKTVANLSNYLIEDYNVNIVVFRNTDIKYSYLGNLIVLSDEKNNNFFKKIMFTFSSIRKLKKLKKELNIDYSISFLTTADLLNVFSKNKKTKNYISIRNTDSIYTKNKSYRFMTKISCKLCDHIISISKQVKLDLINNFGVPEDKITTIYNPALKIEFGKSKLKVPSELFDLPVVVNAGRLTEQKGQWHLIRAFSKVVEEIPNANLLILGEGELKNYLQELINHYDLSENVKLLGFVDNPYDYISKASCFAFSSLYEGLGNAVLESIACHTPVISTDCIAGPREILAPNTDFSFKVKDKIDYAEFGILVPVCDGNKYIGEPLTEEENLFAEAIIKYLNVEELQKEYKEKTIERNKDFDICAIIEQWKKLFD